MMVKNSNFSFTKNTSIILELPFSEHIEELRQRFLLLFITILFLTTLSFLEVKTIVKVLEYPINNVKFFQIAPGEYFISTVKISFYTGLLFTGPFLISQIILFLLPGLTKKETKIILPLLISSLILFGLGITFSYYTLIPAALNFFLNYSEEVIEPFWSFDQYFEFILVLFYSTGFAFQIPIIQILIGLLNILSAQQMLNAWRYIILVSTILGAILTPSTDPLTQLLLSLAIMLLYFIGLGILFLIKN
uniref:Sec-independent protein translocase component TatC n=1 Tax=Thalassionema bacillare TaxID=426664 RepID=UPI001EDEC6C0|nr:Sec-independent protein translocase component TatC [Thalassionema bacillare]UHY40493.1 Sec-independent protein translocase component TatC [Thalassionema bacillare]UHY40880.1 Sec-independent protein translocase component TatC [Thalassionema bacillare]UHY41138.1 Sec-independent protein translocase component TatC [Thalassionema bacillare]